MLRLYGLNWTHFSAELDALQGEKPLMRICVDSHIVGEVSMVLDLESHLGKRVIGQSPALEHISQRIATSRASLDDPGKPVGVFLLIGPSGVGKTETALALADLLYGGERNLITINMSEFQEAHTGSTLKGSPPGASTGSGLQPRRNSINVHPVSSDQKSSDDEDPVLGMGQRNEPGCGG